jgi:hypothetical protein
METYLMGLLIVLIVIVIGLLYFISKQVRENKTRLQVGLADLESLKNKVSELDTILQNNRPVDIQDLLNKQNLQFGGEMYEEDVNLNDINEETNLDNHIHFNNEDVDEDDEDEDVDEDEEDEEDVDEEDEEDVDEEDEEDVDEEDVDEEDVDEAVDEEAVDEAIDEEAVDEVNEEEVNEEEVNEEVTDEEVNEEVTDEENIDVSKLEGDEMLKNVVIDENSEKNKRKHKQPSNKAKEFPVGYQLVSEYDECNYEVTLDKNGRARWKRLA